MLSEAKQAQLKVLFAGMPFRVRRQLRLAFLIEQKSDQSNMPWGQLVELLDAAQADEGAGASSEKAQDTLVNLEEDIAEGAGKYCELYEETHKEIDEQITPRMALEELVPSKEKGSAAEAEEAREGQTHYPPDNFDNSDDSDDSGVALSSLGPSSLREEKDVDAGGDGLSSACADEGARATSESLQNGPSFPNILTHLSDNKTDRAIYDPTAAHTGSIFFPSKPKEIAEPHSDHSDALNADALSSEALDKGDAALSEQVVTKARAPEAVIQSAFFLFQTLDMQTDLKSGYGAVTQEELPQEELPQEEPLQEELPQEEPLQEEDIFLKDEPAQANTEQANTEEDASFAEGPTDQETQTGVPPAMAEALVSALSERAALVETDEDDLRIEDEATTIFQANAFEAEVYQVEEFEADDFEIRALDLEDSRDGSAKDDVGKVEKQENTALMPAALEEAYQSTDGTEKRSSRTSSSAQGDHQLYSLEQDNQTAPDLSKRAPSFNDQLNEIGFLKPINNDRAEPRNAMHAFFSTLEGLIIDRPKYGGRVKGFVRASALPFIWRVLNEDTSGVKIKTAWFEIETAPEAQKAEIVPQATKAMHEAALETLISITNRAEKDSLFRVELEARLGDADAYDDLVELRDMLLILPAIEQFEESAFFQSTEEGEPLLDHFAAALDKTVDQSQDLLEFAQYLILNRLQHPVDSLLIWQKMKGSGARPAVGIIIPGHLIEQLERWGQWLEEVTLDTPFANATLSHIEHYMQAVYRGLKHAKSLKLKRIQNKFLALQGHCDLLFSRVMKVIMQDLGALTAHLNAGDEPDVLWVFSADGPEQIARYLALIMFCENALAGTYGPDAAVELRKETATLLADISTAQNRLVSTLYESTGERYSGCLKVADIYVPLVNVLCGPDRLKIFQAELQDAAPQANLNMNLGQGEMTQPAAQAYSTAAPSTMPSTAETKSITADAGMGDSA